jgi:tRNA-2-methylthio-N6-dimethylallyladenosine synthase
MSVATTSKTYYIWTEGCQMNDADSQRLASALEHMGLSSSPTYEHADVVVLNTCVVRQSAEDKAYGFLNTLRPLKKQNPAMVVGLMGCLVGVKGASAVLRQRFPFVDVFAPPSDPTPILTMLSGEDGREEELEETAARFAYMDSDFSLPFAERGKRVTANLPIVYGCSFGCTFCIIPYRRGRERSRPLEEIVAEAGRLINQGVREITLLGQIVDRYGQDQPASSASLPELLRRLNALDGLERIRFLTSHPQFMTAEIIDAVASLPKVMPHFELPVQAGDDQVLANMRRGYTSDDYARLVERIRAAVPGASIATDIIVGFPGETEEQFEHTYDLLAALKLDVAHIARYSMRPGTVATRRMTDDVPDQEKWRRFRRLEALQEGISAEIHAGLVGQTVPVLFEERSKDRWRGRTPTNKLVFAGSDEDLAGQVRSVAIQKASAWSLQGVLAT